jgi:hypothetical protein
MHDLCLTDRTFLRLVRVLFWDQGRIPLDLVADRDRIVVRVVETCRVDQMDALVDYYGREVVQAVLTAEAPRIEVCGLNLAVYRFDFDRGLLNQGYEVEVWSEFEIDYEKEYLLCLGAVPIECDPP